MFIRKKILSCLMICLCLYGCSGRFKKSSDHISYEEVPMLEDAEHKILPPMGTLTLGEKLSFKISWLGISVGQASLTVSSAEKINGLDTALVELTASTTGFFRLIYKVDGVIHSYVDLSTLKPIKYDSDTRINKKIIIKTMNYDFNEKKVFAEDAKGKYVVDITESTLDPLGVFYYFRKNNFNLDEPIDILVNGGKKNFPVRVFCRTERSIRVPAGTFWAFQIEPTDESERQFDDALNAEGSMRIWFSADERRLPLLIALRVPVGSAVATLMDIEYLDSDLTHN